MKNEFQNIHTLRHCILAAKGIQQLWQPILCNAASKKLLQHITVESISCNNTHQVTQGISGQNLLSKILQQCSRILSVQSVKCTQISFLFFSLRLIPETNFSLKKVARFSSYVKGGKLLSQSTMYHSNLSSGGLNRTGLINWLPSKAD